MKKDDTSKKNSPAPKSFKPAKVHVTFSGGIYLDPNEYILPPDIDEETREKAEKILKEKLGLSNG